MRLIGLLRAINVGGTGKLPMADLRRLCAAAGARDVRTYIASGNVVFDWDGTADSAKVALEAGLAQYAGKPVPVMIREVAEMVAVIADNPFAVAPGNQVLVTFLDQPARSDVLKDVKGQADEDIAMGKREVYVHYPTGIGLSRLRIPGAAAGTARNMNTVAKLAAMAAEGG